MIRKQLDRINAGDLTVTTEYGRVLRDYDKEACYYAGYAEGVVCVYGDGKFVYEGSGGYFELVAEVHSLFLNVIWVGQ